MSDEHRDDEQDKDEHDKSEQDKDEQDKAPEEHWEERLAVPVLLAALVSVPAVFLTLLDDPYGTVGTYVNWLAGAVLVGETVVLFYVSRNKRQWIRKHVWLIALTVVVIVGVVFAIGPVQLLRLVRVFGALRLVRAGRIVKAGRILRRRLGLSGFWASVPAIAASLLVAAFVGVVLADPTSQTRTLVENWVGPQGVVIAAIVAGVLLAAATFVVIRQQQDNRTDAT
ncbi:MAG: ion transporter [Intrasporangiaceae bacterium]|nr:ion transporter [Intrasporangiaceae bacterium]